ncbi:hypothetical protein J2S16_001590 [Cytobacillus kochii]|nr:hypothetical protein [Cytobacillus kochii]
MGDNYIFCLKELDVSIATFIDVGVAETKKSKQI